MWLCSSKTQKPRCLFSLSPRLTSLPSSFSLPVICQAAQLLALSPPAQDRLDFFSAKELCSVPKPRRLTSARPFPSHSLQLALLLPRLLFPPISTSQHTRRLHSSPLHCRGFICIFQAPVNLSINFICQATIKVKFYNLSVPVGRFLFFSPPAD